MTLVYFGELSVNVWWVSWYSSSIFLGLGKCAPYGTVEVLSASSLYQVLPRVHSSDFASPMGLGYALCREIEWLEVSPGNFRQGLGVPLFECSSLSGLRMSAAVQLFAGSAFSYKFEWAFSFLLFLLWAGAHPSAERISGLLSFPTWTGALGQMPGAYVLGDYIFAVGNFLTFLMASGCPSPFGSAVQFFQLGSLKVLVLLYKLGRARMPSKEIVFAHYPLKALVSMCYFFYSFYMCRLTVGRMIRVDGAVVTTCLGGPVQGQYARQHFEHLSGSTVPLAIF